MSAEKAPGRHQRPQQLGARRRRRMSTSRGRGGGGGRRVPMKPAAVDIVAMVRKQPRPRHNAERGSAVGGKEGGRMAVVGAARARARCAIYDEMALKTRATSAS